MLRIFILSKFVTFFKKVKFRISSPLWLCEGLGFFNISIQIKIRGNFIFIWKMLVHRLSFRNCSQLAHGIAVPLQWALGVCTDSNGPCSFLQGPKFDSVWGNLRPLGCFDTALFCLWSRKSEDCILCFQPGQRKLNNVAVKSDTVTPKGSSLNPR